MLIPTDPNRQQRVNQFICDLILKTLNKELEKGENIKISCRELVLALEYTAQKATELPLRFDNLRKDESQ